MEWSVILPNALYMLGGLKGSFELAGITIVLSFPLGCLLAIGRLSSNPWIKWFCSAFVNILRSNPLILILFWFYFLVPFIIGRPVGDLMSAVIAFVIFFCGLFRRDRPFRHPIRGDISNSGGSFIGPHLFTDHALHCAASSNSVNASRSDDRVYPHFSRHYRSICHWLQ